MKLLILSDLHLEFTTINEQKKFIKSLDNDVDALILAGDITTRTNLINNLELFCSSFKNVVYIHGNHEYYGSSIKSITDRMNILLAQNKNLFWLNNSTCVIDKQRFVGTTLWFPFEKTKKNQDLSYFLNDFEKIEDFSMIVDSENQKSQKFLTETVQNTDIVITHHLPSKKSISSRFENNDLNMFYITHLDEFIVERGPKLWVHGHTHDSFDYEINHKNELTKTRVICNPRGYFPKALNPEFNKNLIVEV
jgi:Icc-related predicted phosphoesterase